MNKNKIKAPHQRIIVTLAVLLFAILVSIVLDATGQVAGWVAQIVIALAFGRLCFLAGWAMAKHGWGWRV